MPIIDVGNNNSPQIPFLYNFDLLYYPGKDSGVVSNCFYYSLEFRGFFFLYIDLLPPIFKETILTCYLIHNKVEKRWIQAFLKGICVKVNATDQAGI